MRNLAVTRTLMVAALLALAGCGGTSTTTSSTDSGAPGAGTTAGSAAAQKAPAAPPMVVAAGTVIPVTIDQSIGTKNNVGDAFDATVMEAVVVDGKVAIPKGAKATGHVAVSDAAGHIKGGAALAIDLDSVTLGGAPMQIHTASFSESGKGRGKRTAEGAGIGAAAGAVIGAIAGGGKGAAIGAGAGAGAGTAGAAFTGNRDITIPAETKINFKLTQDLEIGGK